MTEHDQNAGEARRPEFPDREAFREIVRATHRAHHGSFPRGRLTPHDEGALALGVGAFDGAVVLQFGDDIGWFAMPPELTTSMAGQLVQAAREALDQHPRPIVPTPGPLPAVAAAGGEDYGGPVVVLSFPRTVDAAVYDAYGAFHLARELNRAVDLARRRAPEVGHG